MHSVPDRELCKEQSVFRLFCHCHSRCKDGGRWCALSESGKLPGLAAVLSGLVAVLRLSAQVIGAEAQEQIYDRLLIDNIWHYKDYLGHVTDAGFEVDWHEDLTEHLIVSYNKLSKSALLHGMSDLEISYQHILDGIKCGDFGWGCFVATKNSKKKAK